MTFERTTSGILVGENYLSAAEALDLLHWLADQRSTLWLVSHLANQRQVQASPQSESRQQSEWSLADEEEMRSEDEQIACFQF